MADADIERVQAGLDRAEVALKRFSDSVELTEKCVQTLSQSRAALAAGRVAEAQDLQVRLECLLARAASSDVTLKRWGAAIAVFELAALGLLMWGILASYPDAAKPKAAEDWVRWLPLLPYCLWGALGGTVAALFGLYQHAWKRDFDRGFVPWYFLKPALGFVLGPVVYMYVKTGLALQYNSGADLANPQIVYLAAFVAGFAERFSIRLIDRVGGAIFGGEATTPEPAAARVTAPTTAPQTEPEEGEQAGGILASVTGVPESDLAQTSVRLLQEATEVLVLGHDDNQTGTFAATGVEPGEYQLEGTGPGGETGIAPVSVVAGKTTEVDLKLV